MTSPSPAPTTPVQDPPFDVDGFPAQPLTARVATNGPTVRPTRARLSARVREDPGVVLVVEVREPTDGLTRQVIANGSAELLPFDVPRGRRKLSRYPGPDGSRWDERFRRHLHDDPGERGTVWSRPRPRRPRAAKPAFRVG
ncbi:pyridoxamine 5'-phosphate oxidase family protein [Streptomyces alkaliphilus]|uniref:pyridoxamine 5'-phosphate oxidase family protein n=1 Tax=Streptomyces alkaliphilus TaxID=1472722 RepID=UPI00117E8DAC|nr:pyridoxamine 5'-phosphate oxidase family protein [Streptomyces alkaliphilus]MQS06704.1 pyridoxamine 5'-phosphate oxidase family protein [Streptomyces alkaliphilus]